MCDVRNVWIYDYEEKKNRSNFGHVSFLLSSFITSFKTH